MFAILSDFEPGQPVRRPQTEAYRELNIRGENRIVRLKSKKGDALLPWAISTAH